MSLLLLGTMSVSKPFGDSGFKFQILPRMEGLLICTAHLFIQERTVPRVQQHMKNQRSVQCTETGIDGLN